MLIINHLVDAAEKTSGYSISKNIATNSFLFVLSSVMGISRLRIKYSNSSSSMPANFFGVTLAHSGDGKDLTLKIAETMFEEPIQAYAKIGRSRYLELSESMPNGEIPDDTICIIPQQYKVPIMGSDFGMMRVANFYNAIDVETLNVTSTEFGHEISQELLSILIKLWQDGTADGSTNVNEKYPPVTDVTTNALLFGSAEPFERHPKKHEQLSEMIMSGLGRRAIFMYEPLAPKERREKSFVDFNELKEYAQQIKFVIQEIKNKQSKNIIISSEAKQVIDDFSDEVLETFNTEQNATTNMFRNSINTVERLSGIIAVANLNKIVEKSDMESAIEIMRNSILNMKKIIEPQEKYRTIFSNVISKPDTWFSMIDFENIGVIFKSAQERDYHIEMLEEFCYFNGVIFEKNGKRFKIREQESTDINKMIVSVSVNNETNKPEREVEFHPMHVPFFGRDNSIEALVQDEVVKSFTLNHFSPKNGSAHGYRDEKCVIQCQNMIAFDVDNGMTIHEAKNIFEPYQYLIYTTRNHNKPKKGKVCERFRIIIPTKTIFKVSPEQHKILYENISDFLNIPMYDVSTRNIGRLWFTSPYATVITHNSGELFDVQALMPDTKTVENIINQYVTIENISDDDEVTRRVEGFVKWAVMEGVQGDRNNTLSNLAYYLIDIGYNDIENIVKQTNEMFSIPLPEKEVNTIIKHKLRRM